MFITLCFGLGKLPLMQPDEGRNAEVAREMKASSSWLVPTYNGVDYLDKPAFYFKAVALSLAAFGDNETAARLPSSLFGVALVVMVFAFCRRTYGSPRVAWLAVIIVATMPLYFAHARIVIFDIALAFFVCGAIFSGFLAEETEGRSRRNWYLLGSAAAGFATLVKGPVGFLIPCLVLLVAQPLAGRRGAWKRLFAPLNLAVFFGITLPWFVGLCLKRPDFLQYGLVEESFKRFTDAQAFQRGKPFYYYAIIVAATFFPWSLLLPEAVAATWKRRWARHRADWLCLVWSVLVLVFFSISQSKQPGYVLSVCVSCGILLARMFDAALTNPQGRAARLLRRATLVFAVLCLAGLTLVILGAVRTEKLTALTGTSVEEAKRLQAYAWPMAIFLGVLVTLGTWGVIRQSVWLCFLSLALCCPSFIAVNFRVLEVAFEGRSGRAVAELLRWLPKETELAALECFPNGTPFYLGRTLTLISDDGRQLTSNYIISRLKKSSQWPSNIVPVAELDRWLASRKTPVYLIVRARARERLESIAAARGASVQPITQRFYGALLPVPGVP